MIKNLTYNVTFPTGRVLNETVSFNTGLGAITGPNEAGKSFIIEMIRFGLFGTRALRGKVDDYKKLAMEMSFTIKSVDYTVRRTITNARIMRGEEVIAAGVTPVNEKIVSILGYGLDVFDMANVARQDELLKLGDLRPAERKRMVDSVIGLGVLDDLAKSAGEEAARLGGRAEDLEGILVKPVEPTEPANYQPSATLAETLKELRKQKSELDLQQGWLSFEMKQPIQPVEEVQIDGETLQAFLDNQNTLRRQLKGLEDQLTQLPKPSQFSDEQLDQLVVAVENHDRYLKKARFLNQYAVPTHTADQLNQIEGEIAGWERYREYQGLMDRLEHLRSHGDHTCPACSHSWPVEADQLTVVEDRIADLKAQGLFDKQPALTSHQVAGKRDDLAKWGPVADQWEELKDFPDEAKRPLYQLNEIEQFRRANGSDADRQSIITQIQDLDRTISKQPDYAAMLRKRQSYEAALGVFQEREKTYQDWLAERQQRLITATMLEASVVDLPKVEQALQDARLYEAALESYTTSLKTFQDGIENIAGLRNEAEGWRRVRVALTALRSMVKQHLVPSLNKVASQLLVQMTGGQRQVVEVDEDFNVLIDGQSIDTLSGSGKAVANLALRLGLGQVLTNNVLSLFMGDEIDASMDKSRAENTTFTLQTLKRKISQILLVTHKYPTADYHISLGENVGPHFE